MSTAPADAPTYTVSGTLGNAGGPAPGGVYPFAGVVTFRGGGRTRTATAGVDGRFSIDLPDGTYTATGIETGLDSPEPGPTSGPEPCTSDPVTVHGAAVTDVGIYCSIP